MPVGALATMPVAIAAIAERLQRTRMPRAGSSEEKSMRQLIELLINAAQKWQAAPFLMTTPMRPLARCAAISSPATAAALAQLAQSLPVGECMERSWKDRGKIVERSTKTYKALDSDDGEGVSLRMSPRSGAPPRKLRRKCCSRYPLASERGGDHFSLCAQPSRQSSSKHS
jgi:hypothetical protein